MYEHNRFEISMFRGDCLPADTWSARSDVDLLYVIRGSIRVKMRDMTGRLEKRDVLLVNSGILYTMTAAEDSIVCRVRFDYRLIVHMLRRSNSLFVCDGSRANPAYKHLQELCEELVGEEVLRTHRTNSKIYGLLYRILDLLCEEFLVEDAQSYISDTYENDEKINRVIRYVHENYQNSFSLAELAADMYISTSTLSRLFKKKTGVYFTEYVNRMRVKYAVHDMLYTKKNITNIAMDCGFSNISSFNKVFREMYDTTPSGYRIRLQEECRRQRMEQEQIKQSLRDEKTVNNLLSSKNRKNNGGGADSPYKNGLETICVDVSRYRPYDRIWCRTINVGSMHNLMQTNVQYHTTVLVKELGFTHARVWSVFSKNLMIFNGDTIGMYNYDTVDMILDFLVSNHIYPWLDFTKRPNANVKAAANTLWFEDETISFQSARVFEAFLDDFFKHIVRRYGQEEVGHWYFEIGCDPFHEEMTYFPDPQYRFSKLYQYFYKVIRTHVPQAQIGYSHGPLDPNHERMIERFSEAFSAGHIPDFISIIAFPYVPKFGQERTSELPFVRSDDRDHELKQVETMRYVMERSGSSESRLFISEWNVTASTRNFLNDSCFRAACMCAKLNTLIERVDQVGFWISSDWISNYYDSHSIVNGSGGFLTKDGIRKPVFFALYLMNRLGGLLVAQGDNFILTRKENGHLYLLYYNLVWYTPDYFLRAENLERVEHLQEQFVESGQKRLRITLEGMEDGRTYMVKKRIVNHEHGSILDEWEKFNYETKLERSDVKYLQEICIPLLGMERMETRQSSLYLDIHMQNQEIGLYHIFPAD